MVDDPDTSLPSGIPERSDSAQDELPVADTQGGSTTAGNVSGTGIAIGPGAQVNVLFTEEQAYNVSGMPNPYLGLCAFTAAERDIFAGRERIVHALVDRVSADDGDRLLFIVGASGSGKSSLARAGLLPNLTDRLRDAGYTVQTRIIDHPGRMSATSLASILQDVPDNPSSQCLLLLIDQFEELFSHADPAACDQTLSLLIDIAANNKLSVRIITTMRSDFLPQLVADSRFETIEQRKVVIRAMRENDLRDAIQRPIQVRNPNKHLEPALLEQLVKDAAADAAYLPLLQVTLEDLWRGGELRLSHYNGLADAIQRRADVVYTYRDYDGLQQERRTPEEQQALLALLLDLVRVSPGEQVYEVRWQRTCSEVTHGDPQRERLIADLTTARLLATDRAESEDRETVDLVHEALLTGWSRLKEVIAAEHDHLRRRERFLLALQEWQANGQHDDYLLSGVRLAEAEALQQRGDSLLQQDHAQAFFVKSLRRRDAERKRQIRRARLVVAGLSVLTLVALMAAGFAGWFGTVAQRREAEARDSAATAVAERQRAEQQTRVARSRALIVESMVAITNDTPVLSALLMLEAINPILIEDHAISTEGEQALRDSMAHLGGEPYFVAEKIYVTAISAEGHVMASGGNDGTVRVWNLLDTNPHATMRVLYGHDGDVGALQLSANGKLLITGGSDGTVRLWDLTASDPTTSVHILKGHTSGITSIALSNDGHTLVTGEEGKVISGGGDLGNIRVWDLTNPDPQISVRLLHPDGNGWKLALSGDGKTLVSLGGSFQNVGYRVQVWDLTVPNPNISVLMLPPKEEQSDAIYVMALSDDGHTLAIGGEGGVVKVWKLTAGLHDLTSYELDADKQVVMGLVLSTSGDILVSSGSEQVRVWDLTAENPEKTVKILHGDGSQLALSADAHTLVAGGALNPYQAVMSPRLHVSVKVWDIKDQNPEYTARTLYGHQEPITSIALSDDGHTFVTGSLEGSVRVWNLNDIAINSSSSVWYFSDTVRLTELSLNGQTLVTVEPNQHGGDTISIYTLSTSTNKQKRPIRILHTRQDPIATIRLSPNGNILMAVHKSGEVTIWNIITENTYTIPVTRGSSLFSVMSTDTDRFAAELTDNRIAVWDLAVNDFDFDKPLYTLQGNVSSFRLSDDGTVLIAVEEDMIKVYDLQNSNTKSPVHILKTSGINCDVILSKNNQTLVARCQDGDSMKTIVNTWDLTTEDPKKSAHIINENSYILDIDISKDGRILVAGGNDHVVKVWNLQENAPRSSVQLLHGHEGLVTSVVLDTDGKQLISGSFLSYGGNDYSMRLWRLDASDPQASMIMLHRYSDGGWTDNVPMHMRFTTDGDSLITLYNNRVEWWPLQLDDLIAQACPKIGRNLSLLEWQEYFGDEPYHRTCPNFPDGVGVNQNQEPTP